MFDLKIANCNNVRICFAIFHNNWSAWALKSYALPLISTKRKRTIPTEAKEKHWNRPRLPFFLPFFFPRVRKPRKRTMAQSKNRLVLAIKRHALSIHERKIRSARCTVYSRETFVPTRPATFRTQRIFLSICRYNSRKSGTDVRRMYPPM